MIDLLNVQPTTISRTLKDKYMLIYSLPKVGKTTFAAEAGSLLFAFEQGYNGIAGLSAVPINKWSEVKQAVKQLAKDEVKEKYETVAFDTTEIAYGYCEKYICAQNNVETIGDIPWGAGYKMVKEEFENTLRQITKLGYGLILIAHADIKNVPLNDGSEEVEEHVKPLLNKRAYAICNGLVDIIGYIGIEYDDEGNSKRTLYTKRTKTITAGSRFPHLPGKIPFGYEELTKALTKAIETSGSKDGATIVDTAEVVELEPMRPFSEAQAEAKEIWMGIMEDEGKVKKARRIIKDIMGKSIKLSEFTENQQDQLELVIEDLKTL